MRIVSRLTIVLIVAALAAVLVDISPASARPGGGRGRSGPSLNRAGAHHSPGGPAGNLDAAPDRRSRDHDPAPAGNAGTNSPAGSIGPRQLQSLLQSGPGGPNGPQHVNGQQLPQNWQQQAAAWQQQEARWRQNQAAQGNWQSRTGQVQQNVQAWWNNYQTGPQPFTPAWYAQHPTAWQVTHPYADQWAVATTAAVATWLGWAYAPQPSYSSTTIIYEDAPEETEQPDALAQVYVDASPSDVPLPAGQWLPLGVWSLVTAPGQPAMQLVQLAVDRQGVIRGVYYDALTNTSHNVAGQIDRATGLAQWSPASNPNLAFRTGIDQLTQPQGLVEVSLPGGVVQWQIVRMENAAQ